MNRMRRSFGKNRLLWYGLIGAVVLVLAVVAVTVLGQADLGKKTYTGDFAQAGGVRSGDKVRVAGVEVGEVKKTTLDHDHVTISMKVDNDVDVTANGSAEIKMSTLLGQRYIDVSLGNSPNPAPNGVIGETRVPYDLNKTIEQGTPVLAGVNDDDLAQSVRTLDKQLAGAPALTKPTVDALTEMSTIITNRRDEINQLLTDTKTVTSVVNNSQSQLSLIVGQGQQLATKIATREALLDKLLDGIAQFTEQARAVAADNGDRFAPILSNLNTMSQGLEKNRDNLRKLLEILPVTARMTNNVMGDGPYTNGYLPWGLFPDNWLCTARVVDGC